jgi:hypothetical protein
MTGLDSKACLIRRIRQSAVNTRYEAEYAFARSRADRGYCGKLTITESALIALSEDCTNRIKICDAVLATIGKQ